MCKRLINCAIFYLTVVCALEVQKKAKGAETLSKYIYCSSAWAASPSWYLYLNFVCFFFVYLHSTCMNRNMYTDMLLSIS